MKNIRMYEDGNRLIIVLEGYEKSVQTAMMEMINATVNKVDHLKPHTGEDSFQFTGKEIPVCEKEMTEESPGPQIQAPAFVKQMEAKKNASKKAEKAEVKTETERTSKESKKPAKEPVSPKNEPVAAEEPVQETKATDKMQKPLQFMHIKELREYLASADQQKLSSVVRKKGRYPSVEYLLRAADERTLREYAMEISK